MQPYLFPYLGYFQLINAVDKFVICDDVQYIKEGFINRNNVMINKQQHLFTFSVKKDKRIKLINERYYYEAINKEIKNFYNMITISYKKAKYFNKVFELIDEIFRFKDLNVAKFNFNALKVICSYIGIDTEFIIASDIPKNNMLRRQDMVLEINKILKSSIYINAIGGTALYSKDIFEKNNIKLYFIKTSNIE